MEKRLGLKFLQNSERRCWRKMKKFRWLTNQPVGIEMPNYGESSKYFTIKVHHGGDFDDDLNGYHGGEISYFDMCARWHFNICLNLYTTDSMIDFGSDFNDFSFTQFEEDERIERIEQIREEREYGDEGEELPKEDEGVEDDKLIFEGDSCNVDSSYSDVDILPKKKKRIPPPNPPYRTRKRGRYSMLRRVDQEKKLKEEGVQPDEGTSKVRTCTKCKQVGHNKGTCKNESVDTNNGKKPTRDKKNGKKPNVKPPIQQPNFKSSLVKHVLRSRLLQLMEVS
ncbi:hypothetical protein POM88_026995 [Heracleum sosnowskyi]|uniref:Uncharacterized protein n=1 Tax=Heracleum sosnowskyi TaxID=360622 RepID=A0AAD8MP41_9APIA|nr:hypothetical protein POM88_026995 [Heracleum sosnowskyi]